MGYFLRVLSTSAVCPPVAALQAVLDADGYEGVLLEKKKGHDGWTKLLLRHRDGTDLAGIQRIVVELNIDGSGGLDLLAREVAKAGPASAVGWLREYFLRIQTIYVFEVLDDRDRPNGWEIMECVRGAIWAAAPAIFHADAQGFTNERGVHILWQFSENISGEYRMAVLQDGEWKEFVMDLGDRGQRAAFRRGEVPAGARVG